MIVARVRRLVVRDGHDLRSGGTGATRTSGGPAGNVARRVDDDVSVVLQLHIGIGVSTRCARPDGNVPGSDDDQVAIALHPSDRSRATGSGSPHRTVSRSVFD